MFNFKTTKKQIEIFERNVAEILKINFPAIHESWVSSSNDYSIQFLNKPCGIYLSRNIGTDNFEAKSEKKGTNFDIYGLKVFNKKRKEYEEVTLFFNANLLTLIELKNPSRFHANYDYGKLQLGKLSSHEVYDQNQDEKITLAILKDISKDKLSQLDIDKAIEIEINKNKYYTILDMEEGNYIAVNKSGKVYRLDHKNIEKVKEIANDIVAFFNLYKGNKSNLMQVMY
jgi:hypothetical protein